MVNPWLKLSAHPPYVLAEDAAAIEAFNRKATTATKVHLELLPEPFLGDPSAPVVLLGLNPGFSPADVACHLDSTFIRLCRGNLAHHPAEYPFYLLNPGIDAPGRRWWERKLARVVDRVPQQIIATRMLCVEYFGYHSDRFAHERVRLPSQEYSFALVRDAMARDALIVLMRSHRLWFAAIPELRGYSHLFTLRSVQNPSISLRNCPDGFQRIISVMGDAAVHQCSG